MRWHILHYDPSPQNRGHYRFESCRRAGCKARRVSVRFWPATDHGRGDWPALPLDRRGEPVRTTGWRQPPDGAWPPPDLIWEDDWVKFVAMTETFPLADETTERLRREGDW